MPLDGVAFSFSIVVLEGSRTFLGFLGLRKLMYLGICQKGGIYFRMTDLPIVKKLYKVEA